MSVALFALTIHAACMAAGAGEAAPVAVGKTTQTFLEFKLPKTNNEYDSQFLDQCQIGQEWVLKMWKMPEAEWKEKLG